MNDAQMQCKHDWTMFTFRCSKCSLDIGTYIGSRPAASGWYGVPINDGSKEIQRAKIKEARDAWEKERQRLIHIHGDNGAWVVQNAADCVRRCDEAMRELDADPPATPTTTDFYPYG